MLQETFISSPNAIPSNDSKVAKVILPELSSRIRVIAYRDDWIHSLVILAFSQRSWSSDEVNDLQIREHCSINSITSDEMSSFNQANEFRSDHISQSNQIT
jgi:hypothetical protein